MFQHHPILFLEGPEMAIAAGLAVPTAIIIVGAVAFYVHRQRDAKDIVKGKTLINFNTLY